MDLDHPGSDGAHMWPGHECLLRHVSLVTFITFKLDTSGQLHVKFITSKLDNIFYILRCFGVPTGQAGCTLANFVTGRTRQSEDIQSVILFDFYL